MIGPVFGSDFRWSRFAIFSCCRSFRCCSFCRFLKVWGPRPAIISSFKRHTPGSSPGARPVSPGKGPGRADRLPALAAPTAARTTPSAARGAESAATTAGWLGPGFVHVHCAAVQFRAVELRNRRFGIPRFRHFDEGKPARLSAVAIGHDTYALHVPVLAENALQLVLGSPVAQVPYKDIGHKLSFEIEIVFVELRKNLTLVGEGARRKALDGTDAVKDTFILPFSELDSVY
jgi:hypothetical protein